MSALVTLIIVGAAVAVGVWSVAVLERLVRPGARASVGALFAPVSAGWSMLRRERLVPRSADRLLFVAAPFVALAFVVLGALVIPAGPTARGIDSPVGLFFFLVVISPVVVALMIAGWAQGTPPGVVGAFRALTLLIAYEVPMGFAFLGPAMHAGSLSAVSVVQAQSTLWYALWQPIGLAVYVPCALMMSFRHPFDLPFAERELGGGVLAEYSGPLLLLFRVALDGLFLLTMAMGVTLFFGGWKGPLLPGPVWFGLKTLALSAVVLWLSRRVPRLRQDQMLALSWKVLVPAGLVNALWVGALTFVVPGGR